MRAFIAIDIPEQIKAEIARQQAEFRDLCRDARWTRPEGIHLTLKFLGEISDEQVKQITHALAALTGFDKFTVEIRSFGFFPDAKRPRVFWAGVTAPDALTKLARAIEDTLEKIGFPREQRAFNPHLTLARFRESRPQPALQAAAELNARLTLGQFEVSQLLLYKSRLTSQGADYLKVARFTSE